MLGVLLMYPHSPLGAVRPWGHAYISVKPLADVLQPINIYAYMTKLYLAICYIYNITYCLNHNLA